MLLTPTTANAQPSGPPTPCGPEAAACVQLSTQTAWLKDGEATIFGPIPISSGKSGWETPVGTSAVDFKDIDHKSSLFDNAPMPYSVFFNGGIAFHQGNIAYASHGCIRMNQVDARMFYDTLQVGDLVQVVN